MAVSYILIRPPQLPELGDPSDAFIVGYDPATDKTVKIKVANIGGGSVSPPLDISWKSNVEYSSGEIVEYGLRLWKSLQGINEGNFPTEGIWWTEVARGNQSITYWTAGVYTQDPTIKIVNDIFYRLDAALPFESVNFPNELASGDWVAIGGGGGGGHTILDNEENTMPTQPALQFGAGFTVTDEVGKTVVEGGSFSESIPFFSGALTFDKNKYIQSYQITNTFQFTKSAGTHYAGAIIEACFIADGVTGHKPTFSSDFNVQYDNWDNTNGAKNLVRMRYLPEGILTEIRKI